MACFLCSRLFSSFDNGGNKVSLTNIFKSLQIQITSEKVEKLCCQKCTRVCNDMTSSLDKMDKIRLELKVKLGQFGLLIKVDSGRKKDNPNSGIQTDNQIDENQKILAKERSLKIFNDEMQPTINLCGLNNNLLENLTTDCPESNVLTYNSTTEGEMQLANFYGLAGTMEDSYEEQQVEDGRLNEEAVELNVEVENMNAQTVTLNNEVEILNDTGDNSQTVQTREPTSDTSVDDEVTSSTTTRKQRSKTRTKINSRTPSNKRSGSRSAQFQKRLLINTGIISELRKAGKQYFEKLLEQQNSDRESEPEKSKSNRRKRSVHKKRRNVTKNRSLGSRTNNHRSKKSCELENRKDDDAIETLHKKLKQKRKKLIIYSDDDDEDKPTPPVFDISSSDTEDDDPMPEIICVSSLAGQHSTPEILEINTSDFPEPPQEPEARRGGHRRVSGL